MVRKSKQQKGDASTPSTNNSGSKAKQADSQLWTALKHEDEEQLLSLLFDEIDDAESGELRRVQKPTARKIVTQPNAKKVLPLSYAVSEGLPQPIIELLLRAGAAVNRRDETTEQSTALHGACWNEDGEAADVLLRAGADPRVVDAAGRTPLHLLATSNATSLLMRILDGVSTTAATTTTKNADDDAAGAGAATCSSPSSAAVRVDLMELLSMGEKAQGSTVLHLALGESTYNFSVAQALCDYLESPARDAAAVAQLVSARTRITEESPLHALVCAANAEDALVETLVRRLLALGADPLARNAALQSVMEVAVSSRPGRSSKASQKLYETLLSASYAKDSSGSFLRATNQNGHALVHVAIAAGNASAVKALAAAVPAADAPALLGGVLTEEGISVVELLATSAAAGAAEMANALIAVKAVARDAFEALRETHAALQAEREKEAAEGEEAEGHGDTRKVEEEEEEEGGGDATATTAVGGSAAAAMANLKRRQAPATGGGAGLSRVQQARRARAATAVQRKQQSSGHHFPGGVEGERGGLFGSTALSTPVKVMGVLLLLSVFISAYTAVFGVGGESSDGL